MTTSIPLIVLAVVAQFVLGGLWYSPLLFGKWWMEVVGCADMSKEEMKKMQKGMGALYATQLALALLTTVAFANLLPYATQIDPFHLAFWIWIGFVFPVQIGSVIWGNTKRAVWAKQIFTVGSCQLVSLLLVAWIVG